MGKGDGDKSGVTADDFGRAPDLSKVDPAKTKTVQTREVGDQYIDHGAVCEGKDDSTVGCFFADQQRDRLIADFRDRIAAASTNYKLALVELKLEALLKKEADLHWAASLALDLIGAHVIRVVGRAVVSLKSDGVTKLTSIVGSRNLDESSFHARASSFLGGLDEKSIEGNVKGTLEPIKKGLVNTIKSNVNVGAKNEKAAKLSYIAQLKDNCDLEFQRFKSASLGKSNDAELFVLWEGFDTSHHTVGKYVEALGAKLERFRKSGVTDLGRKRGHDRQWHRAEVLRDTRVVWVERDDGSKTLTYQSQEGDFNPGVIKRGDPDAGDLFGDEQAIEFGARNAREEVRLDGRVPAEFVEVALARSEQIWGATPTIRDATPSNMFVPQKTQPPPRNMFVPQNARNRQQDVQDKPRNMFVPQKPKLIEPNMDTLPDAFKTTKVR